MLSYTYYKTTRLFDSEGVKSGVEIVDEGGVSGGSGVKIRSGEVVMDLKLKIQVEREVESSRWRWRHSLYS